MRIETNFIKSLRHIQIQNRQKNSSLVYKKSKFLSLSDTHRKFGHLGGPGFTVANQVIKLYKND